MVTYCIILKSYIFINEFQVPEVTRGLIELVDYSQSMLVKTGCSPSMVVHCNLGSDRSSMFVGLSILVQQLRTERRMDIFTVTRKLRSQRQGLINAFVSKLQLNVVKCD